MAEGDGLLNRYRAKSPIGGSNPPLSATFISVTDAISRGPLLASSCPAAISGEFAWLVTGPRAAEREIFSSLHHRA